jgi:spoIIIJ-associated protein
VAKKNESPVDEVLTDATADIETHPDADDVNDIDDIHDARGTDDTAQVRSARTRGNASGAESGTSRLAELEREGDIAADYLEALLDIADFDGDIDMDVEGERAMVSIVGADLQDLVGPEGAVLEALQELTRLAVTQATGNRSRLMLDISGHRAAARERLVILANEIAEQVKATGDKASLPPMTPFERKVVHDAIAEAGLASESEGEEPRRHVVVLPV